MHFSEVNPTIKACISANYIETRTRWFLQRAFQNRCSKIETLLNDTRNMVDFLDFAKAKGPAASGETAVAAIAAWFVSARRRGGSVRNASMIVLVLFDEVLELNPRWETKQYRSKKGQQKRNQRRAPMAPPIEFLIKLADLSIDRANSYGLGLFCAPFYYKYSRRYGLRTRSR